MAEPMIPNRSQARRAAQAAWGGWRGLIVVLGALALLWALR